MHAAPAAVARHEQPEGQHLEPGRVGRGNAHVQPPRQLNVQGVDLAERPHRRVVDRLDELEQIAHREDHRHHEEPSRPRRLVEQPLRRKSRAAGKEGKDRYADRAAFVHGHFPAIALWAANPLYVGVAPVSNLPDPAGLQGNGARCRIRERRRR